MILPSLFTILVLTSNVLARPVISENLLNTREVVSTKFTQRSEWNIIWSCLATLFACSWVAVHPNIPAPSDGFWKIFARRLLMMFYMLLVPEAIIIWAGRQWFAAREIAQRNKERGWTVTHASFALMGGFMLYENGTISRTLAPDELELLFADGRIEWPIISEKEIEDKSKGDMFSKGFAVLQTTWFVTQCIVRHVYRLPLSHLEVVTVAFACLNAVVYFLWWNKPMDVGCPVPVHLLPPLTDAKRETGTQTGNQYHSEADGNNGSQYPSLEPPAPDRAMLTATEPINRVDPQLVAQLEPIESDLSDPHSSIPIQPSSPFTRVCSDIWDIFLMIPSAIFLFLVWKPLQSIWSDVNQMLRCERVDNTQSVPTFYAPESGPVGMPALIGIMVGTLFGGIHCSAWSFPFSSIIEQQLWRISAVLITVVPVSIVVLALAFMSLLDVDSDSEAEGPICLSAGFFALLNMLAYSIARIMLLVLPLLALRSLPSGSFVAVSWSVSIPHI